MLVWKVRGMNMKRFALGKLDEWKGSRFRKPLVLNGARQVGKTWLLKEFGQREYESVAYINCEKAVTIRDGLYYYRARNNSIMATETAHSRLDGLEAFTERLEFLDGHHVMNSSSLPFDYLYDFQLLKKSMTREERKRYRALIKRCAKVYFKESANRKLKGFCRFYLFGLYRRFSKSFRFGK